MTQTRIITPGEIYLETAREAQKRDLDCIDLVMDDCDAGKLHIRLDRERLGKIIAEAGRMGIVPQD